MLTMISTILAFCIASINESYYESTPTTAEALSTSEISSVGSLKELSPILLNTDASTLVIFDVDEVLITTRDLFLKPELEPLFLGRVKQAMEQAKTADERSSIEKKLSVSLTQSTRILVEEEWPHCIRSLQERDVKVLALTSHPTGTFGYVEDVAKWKVDQLESFGFSFAKSFAHIVNGPLTTLCKPEMPSPIYERGVLFSRGYTKGEVLVAFLETRAHYRPKKVIFIDDLAKNLESMACSLKEKGIDFHGYLYEKAHLLPEQRDEALVSFQFDQLMEHGRWLSDNEANSLYKPICANSPSS